MSNSPEHQEILDTVWELGKHTPKQDDGSTTTETPHGRSKIWTWYEDGGSRRLRGRIEHLNGDPVLDHTYNVDTGGQVDNPPFDFPPR